MCAKKDITASGLSFCVVIPVYNESAGVDKCIRSVCNRLNSLPYRTALIVVDDGSSDDTGLILKRLVAEFAELHVLSHNKNLGYGSALKSGTKRAAEMGFESVLFMDSDLTNDPMYLPLFVEKMKQGYDVIKASRYIDGGRVSGVPVWRTIVSVIGNRVAMMLYRLPIRDCTNGFRAVKTDILCRLHLQENGFAIIMEELYQVKFLARTFCEVSYTLGARAKSDRPSSFAYHPKVFFVYLKYAIKSFLKIVPPRLQLL